MYGNLGYYGLSTSGIFVFHQFHFTIYYMERPHVVLPSMTPTLMPTHSPMPYTDYLPLWRTEKVIPSFSVYRLALICRVVKDSFCFMLFYPQWCPLDATHSTMPYSDYLPLCRTEGPFPVFSVYHLALILWSFIIFLFAFFLIDF